MTSERQTSLKPLRGREKRAHDEIQAAYLAWLGEARNPARTTLHDLIRNKLRIADDRTLEDTFNKLAALREPNDDEEREIDKELASGRHVDPLLLDRPELKDFVRCREIFYLQRDQIATILTELEQGASFTFQEIPTVFLIPHRRYLEEQFRIRFRVSRSQQATGKRQKRTTNLKDDDDESCSPSDADERYRWFAKTLEIPLLHRDYELAFLHLTKGRKLAVSMLSEAFANVGLSRPSQSELELMVNDANGDKPFELVFELVKNYALVQDVANKSISQ